MKIDILHFVFISAAILKGHSPPAFISAAISKGHPPPAYQIYSISVQEGSGVSNLQTELNYLNSFKSYCIFSDFIVPRWSPHPHGPHIVPTLSPHCPHIVSMLSPHCPHAVSTSLWSPHCPHIVPMLSPHHHCHSHVICIVPIIPTSSIWSPHHLHPPHTHSAHPHPLEGDPQNQ